VRDTTSALPMQQSPRLALILVPKANASGSAGGGGGGGYFAPQAPKANEGWVFPFDKPLAPDPYTTTKRWR